MPVNKGVATDDEAADVLHADTRVMQGGGAQVTATGVRTALSRMGGSLAFVRAASSSARRKLPHRELARLTQIDYAREMAFIAVR